MSGFVLDCSVAVAWCFKDEDASQDVMALRNEAQKHGVHVPSIWPLEFGNVLLKSERRKRSNEDDSVRYLGFIRTLPILVDADVSADVLDRALFLARRHSLTTYDAAYLELAIRLKLPLATQDADLRKAAAKHGVPLLPEKFPSSA